MTKGADMYSQEKKRLDEEKREYEERKQQLEGLYQKLYRELEEIQELKQGMMQGINGYGNKTEQEEEVVHITASTPVEEEEEDKHELEIANNEQ